MSVTVYGSSDDLIEVVGDLREEFPWYPADGDAFLGFSNGVVLRVTLGDVWRITPVAGAAYVLVEQCPENDEDNYTDRALVSGDVAWVVCGSAWVGRTR
jgi:hypothetical protein